MCKDYKPLILRKHHELTPDEQKEESRMIRERAKEEGRTRSEVFRIALVRMRFADMGKGEFFDEMLVESRKNGEDYMDFIKRMNRTYCAH